MSGAQKSSRVRGRRGLGLSNSDAQNRRSNCRAAPRARRAGATHTPPAGTPVRATPRQAARHAGLRERQSPAGRLICRALPGPRAARAREGSGRRQGVPGSGAGGSGIPQGIGELPEPFRQPGEVTGVRRGVTVVPGDVPQRFSGRCAGRVREAGAVAEPAHHGRPLALIPGPPQVNLVLADVQHDVEACLEQDSEVARTRLRLVVLLRHVVAAGRELWHD